MGMQGSFSGRSFLLPLIFGFILIVALTVVTRPAVAADDLKHITINGKVFSILRDCSDCPLITVIPAGDFVMGLSKEGEDLDIKEIPTLYTLLPGYTSVTRGHMEDEMPQHPVHIARSFGLGTFPVTRGEFASFVKETGYNAAGACTLQHQNQNHFPTVVGKSWQDPDFNQKDDDPVVCVSKQDAEAYIAWLNGKARSKSPSSAGAGPYRLPTEAEWEYAARAGTQTAYWWGDAIGKGNAVCNACGSPWDEKGTGPVDSFKANPFGLYNMAGNAWQITADCWNDSYSNAPADGGAVTIAGCPQYVMRGGDWNSDPWVLRSTDRGRVAPESRHNYVGFRVARDISQ